MRTLMCDICKKVISEPVKERNYYNLVHIELCENCRDELDSSMKQAVRTKSPFSYQWYNDLLTAKMTEGVNKNRIIR